MMNDYVVWGTDMTLYGLFAVYLHFYPIQNIEVSVVPAVIFFAPFGLELLLWRISWMGIVSIYMNQRVSIIVKLPFHVNSYVTFKKVPYNLEVETGINYTDSSYSFPC